MTLVGTMAAKVVLVCLLVLSIRLEATVITKKSTGNEGEPFASPIVGQGIEKGLDLCEHSTYTKPPDLCEHSTYTILCFTAVY